MMAARLKQLTKELEDRKGRGRQLELESRREDDQAWGSGSRRAIRSRDEHRPGSGNRRKRGSSSPPSDFDSSSWSHSSSGSTSDRTDQERRGRDRMKEEIRKLKEEVYGRRGSEQSYRRHESPFTRSILKAPAPTRYKQINMTQYDGTTEPEDHVEEYLTLMDIQNAPDALKCKVFSATLKGPARAWFSTLKPGSISSFDQLSEKFVAHFVSSRRTRKTSNSLIGMVQESGESLRDFYKRFSLAAHEIPCLEHSVAMAVLVNGHRNWALGDSLAKKLAESYQKLLNRLNKYINLEEARKKRPREKEKKKGRLEERPDKEPEEGEKKKRNRKKGPGGMYTPRHPTYSVLSTSATEVLMEVENEPYLKRPPPMPIGV